MFFCLLNPSFSVFQRLRPAFISFWEFFLVILILVMKVNCLVPFSVSNLYSRTFSSSSLYVIRSEEHTSELQSRFDLVCRLLLEKKKSHSASTRRARARHGVVTR